MATATPIAVVLIRFKNDPSEPLTTAAAEQMFTTAGVGTLNVVDWFTENSHGSIDMSGNRVFGWFEIPDTLAQYTAKRSDGTYARGKIVDLARAAATAAGVDLTPFTAVLALTNVGVDLFGGTGAVCGSAASAGQQYWEINAAPSVICQELIHGLGVLNHARRDGSDDDYRDPYDVMSMFNAYAGHHPNYPGLPIGPGLNAAFMSRCGWLDTGRGASGGPVQLRPLHRRDLPGALYATAGRYFVEYRAQERWDLGFTSVVLVHHIANQTSYLTAELRAGQSYSWGDPRNVFAEHGTISVETIDDANLTATVTTRVNPGMRVPVDGPAISLAGGWGDGGGILIIGGKIVRIPPRSPLLTVLKNVAAQQALEEMPLAPAMRNLAQLELLGAALGTVEEARRGLSDPHSPLSDMDLDAVREFQEARTRNSAR